MISKGEQIYQSFISNFEDAIEVFQNMNEIKEKLTYLRWKATENLDQLLFEFETNIKKNNGKITWCTSPNNALIELNKLILNDKMVKFLSHTYVHHFNEINDLKLEFNQDSDTLVLGAKFLIANTGNVFIKLNNQFEYNQVINSQKVIILAGIDSLISNQNDLPFFKQVYSTFENGKIGYDYELLIKPIKNKGYDAEIHLLLIDFGLDSIVQNPIYRPLAYLFNYDFPSVSGLNMISEKEFNLLHQFFYSILLKDSKYLSSFSSVFLNEKFMPISLDFSKILRELKSDLQQENKISIFQKIFGQSFIKKIKDTKKFHQEKNFREYFDNYFIKK